MALEGTIKDFGLADILQLIGLQRKTGLLTLEGSAGRVQVKFLEGSVVGADTSERNFEDLLGSVLVRTGRITEAQLQESLRIQKGSLQRLGYVLVKQHFISDADLEEALRVQVTQIVYRLFRWRQAKYQFAPMDHMEYDHEHFHPVSAETILMEGARMIDEWPLLERKIKSPAMVFRKTDAGIALDVPVSSSAGSDLDSDLDIAFQDRQAPAKSEKKSALSPEEREILHMVDGKASVQDLADMSPLAEFDVYRVLVELAHRSLIEVVEAPVAVPTVGPARASRYLSFLLQLPVLAAAGLSLATLSMNPFTPWKLAARAPETTLLKTYASRSRLERIEQSVQAYYLMHGSMPDGLSALTGDGYLAPTDVVDPWGHSYAYRIDASGYEIRQMAGDDPKGEVVIHHPFTASQRMVLEGGTAEHFRDPRP